MNPYFTELYTLCESDRRSCIIYGMFINDNEVDDGHENN